MSALSGSMKQLAISSPYQLGEVCVSPIWPLAKIYGRSLWWVFIFYCNQVSPDDQLHDA